MARQSTPERQKISDYHGNTLELGLRSKSGSQRPRGANSLIPNYATGSNSSGFRSELEDGVSQRLETQPSSLENAVSPHVTLHYRLLCGLPIPSKNPQLHRPQRLGYKKGIRPFSRLLLAHKLLWPNASLSVGQSPRPPRRADLKADSPKVFRQR
jgi:hypothetical protein